MADPVCTTLVPCSLAFSPQRGTFRVRNPAGTSGPLPARQLQHFRRTCSSMGGSRGLAPAELTQSLAAGKPGLWVGAAAAPHGAGDIGEAILGHQHPQDTGRRGPHGPAAPLEAPISILAAGNHVPPRPSSFPWHPEARVQGCYAQAVWGRLTGHRVPCLTLPLRAQLSGPPLDTEPRAPQGCH